MVVPKYRMRAARPGDASVRAALGVGGPHVQAWLSAECLVLCGQYLPVLMLSSVTRETWKVLTDDGTFP